jgi:predicted SAM-dependent methyltransferase
MKYNFGCGKKSMNGYVNVDSLNQVGNVDLVHDLTEVPYPFAKSNEAEEITSVEFLEHISFRDIDKLLAEWYRILMPGGKLKAQVPDCGKAMEYYVNKQVCDCVPHKADSVEGFKANPDCQKCQGRAKINPIRWIYTFTGAQKHEFDVHRNHFTKESMEKELKTAGFTNIVFKEHIHKLIVEATK